MATYDITAWAKKKIIFKSIRINYFKFINQYTSQKNN